MIFKNNQIYQLNHDEGRATYDYANAKWVYEFDYRDIWGNLRIGFQANGNQLVMTQRNDYDITGFELKPLGLENVATKNNFKFQKQERISDFDIDIDFFKFRPSDSKIVRFWQIDPLASDYVYNSPYALQENKFGLGVELEGAEMQPFYPKLPSPQSLRFSRGSFRFFPMTKTEILQPYQEMENYEILFCFYRLSIFQETLSNVVQY